jgi:hypothetical protein
VRATGVFPAIRGFGSTILLGIPVALLLAGCGGFAQMGRARTLERGQWELGVQGSAVWNGAAEWKGSDPCSPEGCAEPMGLSPELHAAFGVAPWLEAGARLHLTGGELGLKAQLVRSDRFDLAVAPSLLGGFLQRPGDEGGVYARLPLLAGLNLGTRTSVVLAPEAAWALDGGGSPTPELWGGTLALHRRTDGGGMVALGLTWLRFDRRVPTPEDPGRLLVGADVYAVTAGISTVSR